eukprot:4999404-Pyramimonas_sp.AAC.1
MFLIALGPSGTMWSFVEVTRSAPGTLWGLFSEPSWAVLDACWPILGPLGVCGGPSARLLGPSGS